MSNIIFLRNDSRSVTSSSELTSSLPRSACAHLTFVLYSSLGCVAQLSVALSRKGKTVCEMTESYAIPDAHSLWTDPGLDHLGLAILCTLAYADVFDYPLTPRQIHRYLVSIPTNYDQVLDALDHSDWATERLERHGGYVTLLERKQIVGLRRRREEVAAEMWPRALLYGQKIAALPFVRGVALTGALAVDNVEAGDDFDFLIITAVDRLWLTRAMVIGFVVRPASRRGDEVCPNYLLTDQSLRFEERNLYTAHELAHMAPLAGLDIYRRLRATNQWTSRFLPNAAGLPRPCRLLARRSSRASSLAELALGTSVGAGLERFERNRKIRRFAAQRQDIGTTCFSGDRCKGHFDSNEKAVLRAFDQRLTALAEL